MIKSEKRLLIINFSLIFVFFLSIFVKNVFDNYLMTFVLIFIAFIIILLMGYEKERNIFRKNMIFFIIFYSIIFLIFYYAIGLVMGYSYTGYSHLFISFIKNILPVIMVIISSEYLRYLISKKGEKNKIIYITTVIVFVLIDVVLNLKYYNVNILNKLLELLTFVFLPSIFKNMMLTSFSYKYGFIQNIVYRLIMELYVYIIPVVPATGIYIDSVLFMAFPVFLKQDINYRFRKDEKVIYYHNKTISKIISIILILFTALMILLVSNVFRFWLAVIASGSMEPTINIGDAVIVDKSYKNRLNELKVGDVVVFKNKSNNKIYTHRIIEIKEKNGNYKINTKGDRKGNAADNWIVSNDNVVGVVRFKIRYIGYPTVWLSRIMEGKNENN